MGLNAGTDEEESRVIESYISLRDKIQHHGDKDFEHTKILFKIVG